VNKLSRASEEAQILSVLDAISANNDASQRELSKATGLNVAKVNHLLKKLVEKGCLKLRNVSRNPNKLGYLYILTPSGITEKSRLTIRFAMRTWREYAKTLEKLGKSLNALSQTGAKKVLLLGANEVTDMVIEVVGEIEALEVVGIVDPKGESDFRKGVPIINRANSNEFDRAISCEQVGVKELVDKFGVTEEQLWLV
jgi:EPS-associated MarR family transcriptional regulator